MKGSSGDIFARVHFFADGGRKGPTPETELNCFFSIDDKLFDCRLYLHEVGSVAPGQSVEIPIAFLNRDLVLPRLDVGSKFRLRELGYTADGEVLALMPVQKLS